VGGSADPALGSERSDSSISLRRESLYPTVQARSRGLLDDVPVVDLDDLIQMKLARGRPRDLADVAALTDPDAEPAE